MTQQITDSPNRPTVSSEADIIKKNKKNRGVRDIVKEAIETLNLSKDLEQKMGFNKKKEQKISQNDAKCVEN